MLVAIPSKGRAGRTKSEKLFSNIATLYVPENEKQDYLKTFGRVEGVPNSVFGITKTRNWILKNTPEKYVVFVDDDVQAQGYFELLETKSKSRRLDESVWIQTFSRLFDVTEGMNYKIWGVSTEGSPRATYPYNPFLFYSYVTASCMGIINDGAYYFDESFQVKEDYELCLRHIKERGGIVAARYVFWQNEHWKKSGGCVDYRTQAMEADCTRRLMRMYPGMIRQVKKGGSKYSIMLDFKTKK